MTTVAPAQTSQQPTAQTGSVPAQTAFSSRPFAEQPLQPEHTTPNNVQTQLTTSQQPGYYFGNMSVLPPPQPVIQREGEAAEQEGEQTNRQENQTGLPDPLKAGMEAVSGLSMDDVNVHYNSPEPAQVGALAHAQGTDIHLGPGQEKHLPHEAWHVVQQKQGRVQPTGQAQGVAINNDPDLEQEASTMGRKAVQTSMGTSSALDNALASIATPASIHGAQVLQGIFVDPDTARRVSDDLLEIIGAKWEFLDFFAKPENATILQEWEDSDELWYISPTEKDVRELMEEIEYEVEQRSDVAQGNAPKRQPKPQRKRQPKPQRKRQPKPQPQGGKVDKKAARGPWILLGLEAIGHTVLGVTALAGAAAGAIPAILGGIAQILIAVGKFIRSIMAWFGKQKDKLFSVIIGAEAAVGALSGLTAITNLLLNPEGIRKFISAIGALVAVALKGLRAHFSKALAKKPWLKAIMTFLEACSPFESGAGLLADKIDPLQAAIAKVTVGIVKAARGMKEKMKEAFSFFFGDGKKSEEEYDVYI